MKQGSAVLLASVLFFGLNRVPRAADTSLVERADVEELRHAIKVHDWLEGDAAARRLAKRTGWTDAVIDYWIRHRGSCKELKPGLPYRSEDSFNDDLYFDAHVCLAAHEEQHDGQIADRLLGAAIDASGKSLLRGPGQAFERFARADIVDGVTLSFLHRKGLDRWWDANRGSGLETQIVRLDVDNIGKLLRAGVDPNRPVGKAAQLPLQLLRDASLTHEVGALAAAREMVAQGADPNMLVWFKDGTDSRGKPGSPAFEALTQKLKKGIDPVRIDVMGVVNVVPKGEHGENLLRLRVGNASARPVLVRAWVVGSYSECSLGVADYEYQPPFSSTWKTNIPNVEDGTSADGYGVIPPGEARELACLNSNYLQAPPGSRFRLSVSLEDGVRRYSAPFWMDDQNLKQTWVEVPPRNTWH